MTTMTVPGAPAGAAEPMVPRPFRVTGTRQETADTATLELVADDGEGMRFLPGQYTMLYVFGVGEVPISISGSPHRPDTLVHTVRAVGAVTRALVALQPGDTVGVRGPFGTGWPVGAAEGGNLMVVAGGIGLAPLRPVALDVLARRDRFDAVALVYGARSPEDLLYRDQLAEWRDRADLDVGITVDVSSPGWTGDVGVVIGLLPRVSLDPGRTVAMLCGPEIMMRVVARQLEAGGMAADRIYVSIERNMKCAIGLCGHCQFGPDFVCWGGPVFPYTRVADRMLVPEL